jgi:hypothetical protein
MSTKDACTSSKTAHPLITTETSASASTPFSQVDGLAERRRYHGHLVPPILLRCIFSCEVLSKTECTYHPYLQMSHNIFRSDARNATSRMGRNWMQMGRLRHHKWKSYRTITVRGKTWCVCLPAYISKYCVRPLYKFIYASQIVKRLLKHPVYMCSHWTCKYATVIDYFFLSRNFLSPALSSSLYSYLRARFIAFSADVKSYEVVRKRECETRSFLISRFDSQSNQPTVLGHYVNEATNALCTLNPQESPSFRA